MSSRRFVIANLRARGFQRNPRRRNELEAICAGRAQLLATESAEEAEARLAQLSLQSADCCIFAGGDGTLMAGLSSLARTCQAPDHWPSVAVLPLGTVGTVARNLGYTGIAEQVLERLLTTGATESRVSTLRVSDAREQHIGFIFGTGLIANFFKVYEARGRSGAWLAARVVARVFVESFFGGKLAKAILTPMPAQVEVDEVWQPATAYSLLVASVVEDLGLGLRVTYRAREHQDRMHLVASSLPPHLLGPQLPRVLAGRRIGGRDHVDELASHCRVQFPPGCGRYVLDGDSFEADSVSVTMGPNIRMLKPPRR